LEELFLIENGFALRPDLCGAAELEDLIESHLTPYVRLEGGRVVLVDRLRVDQLVKDTKNMSFEKPPPPIRTGSFHSRPNGTGSYHETLKGRSGSHEQIKARWSHHRRFTPHPHPHHHGRTGTVPPPHFSPTIMTSSPNFRPRAGESNSVFTFEQAPPMSPPVSRNTEQTSFSTLW
jgi:hypothetical protein